MRCTSYFALLCGFVRSQDDAIKLLTLMVQIFFLMWSGYNLMRYERIMKTALMTLVISCSAISVMQLLGVAQTQWEFYDAGSRTSVLGQNPNNMANNISLGLVALMGFAFGRNKTSPWAKYVAPLALIMVGAIIDTALAALCSLWGSVLRPSLFGEDSVGEGEKPDYRPGGSWGIGVGCLADAIIGVAVQADTKWKRHVRPREYISHGLGNVQGEAVHRVGTH